MVDILALRTDLNISQKDLAHSLGVTQGAVSHWELRRRPLPTEIFAKLCSLHGEEYVLRFDTLTEDDITPVYQKKGTLFRKPNNLRKVVFEEESLRTDIERLEAKLQQQEEELSHIRTVVFSLMSNNGNSLA